MSLRPAWGTESNPALNKQNDVLSKRCSDVCAGFPGTKPGKPEGEKGQWVVLLLIWDGVGAGEEASSWAVV